MNISEKHVKGFCFYTTKRIDSSYIISLCDNVVETLLLLRFVAAGGTDGYRQFSTMATPVL